MCVHVCVEKKKRAAEKQQLERETEIVILAHSSNRKEGREGRKQRRGGEDATVRREGAKRKRTCRR